MKITRLEIEFLEDPSDDVLGNIRSVLYEINRGGDYRLQELIRGERTQVTPTLVSVGPTRLVMIPEDDK